LVTSLFAHGNWTHVGLNAVGALAFGAPVARFLSPRPAGVLLFFGFFLVCGALAALGFAAVHPESRDLLVGASGGVSGLMGAASRLIERRPGLAPLLSPTVIGMAAGWLVVNLLMALFGLSLFTGGAPVAWEAHLFGYAAGLLLIWPVGRLLGRR
jgi:membrane associated rhomboid family serine protease